MGILYLSAHESFTKKVYDLMVPYFYHPNLPDEIKNPPKFKKEKVNPFKPVSTVKRPQIKLGPGIDPDRLQKASFSIEVMVDMFQRKVEFTIINDHDIPSILDEIDRYLLSLKNDIQMGIQKAIDYARLVIKFRDEVYKDYYRYMNLNPDAYDRLYPEGGKDNNLFSILNMLSPEKQKNINLDPLRARQYPPIDIDQLMPQETRQDINDKFENDFGIAKTGLLKDDGRDFNLTDFLSKE